jgi:hypothetical protein
MPPQGFMIPSTLVTVRFPSGAVMIVQWPLAPPSGVDWELQSTISIVASGVQQVSGPTDADDDANAAEELTSNRATPNPPWYLMDDASIIRRGHWPSQPAV